MTTSRKSSLLGAAFLMATSAIGPGFLTTTTVFTHQLLASCGFAILVSIILDIGAQLNIWRVLEVTERRAQDVANDLLPGLGYVLAGLIVLGGIAFNVGNIGGTGLGLHALLGMDVTTGAVVSALMAIIIFLVKEFGAAMDTFAKVLGFIMIALTLYLAVIADPPWTDIAMQTFVPERVDWTMIITLVGGTVGGYITFAGGHRLLDAGVKGRGHLAEVSRSAVTAIGLASLMRFVLFLAVLGVVSHGFTPDPANPPASVFRQAAGEFGYRIFGLVMWAAAITSVVGAAYTSLSFIKTFDPRIQRAEKGLIIGFILLSLLIFLAVANPVKVLVAVGALNGFILPIGLVVMLIAAHRQKLVGDYRHPRILLLFGVAVAIATALMSLYTVIRDWHKIFGGLG